MTRLHVISGPDIGHSFQVEEREFYVGRSPENEIQIKDRFVSRRHLRIRRKEERYYLEDLESKNGTFVDGALIRPNTEVELVEGVPVVIGMSVICVGEKCSEDILALLESMALGGQARETALPPLQDRPMTSQNNRELLRRVSEVFSQSVDVRDIVNAILDHIFDFFKRIDRGAVVLLDPDTGEISEVVSRVRGSLLEGVERYCQDIVEQVIEERKGVMINDAEGDEQTGLYDTVRLLNVRSVICVPLVSKSRVSGVLYVDSVIQPHGFRKDDLSLFKALSIPAANAIENAMLYARRQGK